MEVCKESAYSCAVWGRDALVKNKKAVFCWSKIFSVRWCFEYRSDCSIRRKAISMTVYSSGGLHEASRDVPYRSRTFNPHLDSRPSQSRCARVQKSDHHPLRCIRNRSFDDQGLGFLRTLGDRRKTNLV